MVYCGKPSKCCQNCRKRDIKCDKRKESCGQCIRARLICPGYPNTQDLLFRDETRKFTDGIKKPFISPEPLPITSQNATKQPNRGLDFTRSSKSTPSCSPRSRVISVSSNQTEYLSSPQIIYPPVSNIEMRAKKFFIKTQVYPKSNRLPIYSFISSISSYSPSLQHILYAIRAVCLLHFSTHHRSSSIMQTARQNYVTALKETQATLFHTAGAKDNSTLVAVLLLDVFERLAGRGNAVEESFQPKEMGHLNGAMALIEFRGEEQFSNSLGLGLFQPLSSAVLTRCLEGEIEVPLQYLALRKMAAGKKDTFDVRWRFEDVVVQLVSLLALVRSEGEWDDKNDAVAEALKAQCIKLCCDIRSMNVSPADVQQISFLNCNTTGSARTEERLLEQLDLILIVLSEYSSISTTSSEVQSDMKAICTSIYAASLVTPVVLQFPLYVAACSRFGPCDLKLLIYDKFREQDDDDALKIVQLLERSEKDWKATEWRAINPWKDFAEQGLGELSMLEIF